MVLERVHRVQPQPVEVVVAQPHQRVADEEVPHLVGAGLVQVDRRAPGGHVRVGEVRAELGQVVADADVVVDDVEQDGQPAGVAGVHEPLQPVRAAVGLVHRPQVDPVVAPAVRPGNAATGISSTMVTPRSRRWSSRSIAASNVPSGVNVPTCSS